MTGLSRCGKRYTSWDDALKAAEARTFKSGRPWHITDCPVGEHWHITEHRAASRPDPFPPAVARLLDARDEHCQRCGATGRLERHHRRAKASGGSGARAHTQCACNGCRVCRGCHRFIHEHPAQARMEGFIVRQSVSAPGKILVSRLAEHGDAERTWWRASCDGAWWPNRVSVCPQCGEPGQWGFDDDWCHLTTDAAITCPREGWYPGKDDQ